MKRLLIVIAIALMTACAQLPTPNTFNDRIGYATSSVTAVLNTTTTLLQAKKITPEEASSVEQKAQDAEAAIQLARSTYGSNPLAAQDSLSATILALTALQNYLISKGQ